MLNIADKPIGNILEYKCLLTSEQVSIVAKAQARSNLLFGQQAVRLGFISEDDLVEVLSEIYNIPHVSLELLYIDQELLLSISYDLAAECKAIPFACDDSVIKIAITDPGDVRAIDKLKKHFKDHRVEYYLAKETEIEYFLEIMKNNSRDIDGDPLQLLSKVIFDAVNRRASDIHFEPLEKFVRVRFRIDGILEIYKNIDNDLWIRIQAKLKLMAELNLTEKRKPQSGHTTVSVGGKLLDLRVSTHPGISGENFVIRVLHFTDGVKALSELGFLDDDYLWLLQMISHVSGIFLIVGPTGAGKTTTLYSILRELNNSEVNIMTLEDPVEYRIEGVRQMDLREEGIVSFANGVRSILRQDPDVLLIGEIRDEATAASALRAALTGRLVLATLHAATPLEGVRRLLDLGLKIEDLVPVLIGIFSQRLVRYKVHDQYKCRFPITEYLSFTDDMKKQILSGESIYNCSLTKSFRTSAHYAIENHLTDKSEICRVLGHGYI